MPGNSFIKFSDITPGESFQESHPGSAGWIEIGDWSWDIEAETSFLKGGGASVGKPQPGTLSFSHFFDVSSPVIMHKIVSGKHFPLITIEMLKQTGAADSKPTTYFQIIVKEAFVTKVSTKYSEDGSLNQDVEVVFKEIAVGYKAQKNLGGLEGSIPFDWSISAMKAESTISGKLA